MPDPTPQQIQAAAEQRAVLTALHVLGRPARVDELAGYAGLPPGTVRRRLLLAGPGNPKREYVLFGRTAGGEWFLTGTGRRAAEQR